MAVAAVLAFVGATLVLGTAIYGAMLYGEKCNHVTSLPDPCVAFAFYIGATITVLFMAPLEDIRRNLVWIIVVVIILITI